jgi:spore coat protein U-like protein
MKSITRLSKRSVKHITTLGLGLLALGLVAAAPALAATATGSMPVTSSVTASCVIAAAPLAFGPYDTVTTANVDADAVLTFTCTFGTTGIQITLGQGLNPASGSSDTVPLRQMASGGGRLAYFLYQQTGRTTVWGNTLATAPAAVVGTGAPQTATVFGRIPSGQTSVPAGVLYTDTVVATVNF